MEWMPGMREDGWPVVLEAGWSVALEAGWSVALVAVLRSVVAGERAV